MHISLPSIAKQLSNVQSMALGISSDKAEFPPIVTAQKTEGGLNGRLMLALPRAKLGTRHPLHLCGSQCWR